MTSSMVRRLLSLAEFGVVFALLIAAVCFLFWDARVDWPQNDHVPYMAERDLVQSDWSWFWHSISYSRARFTLVGDYFAFRPVHMFVLVTQDLLARENLKLTGAVSLFLLAVAGFSLYVAVRHFGGRLLAVPFSLLFIAGLAGSRIVMWRHISPYLLSLTFFGLGIFLLSSSEDKKWAGRLRWASACLFIATLSHEFVLLSLILTVPIFVLRAVFQKNPESRTDARLMAIVLGLPVAANLCLNVLDFVIYHPPSLLGPADSALPSFFAMYAEPVLKMMSSFAVALMVPPSKPQFDYWVFVNTYPMLSMTLGILLIALCYRVFSNSTKEIGGKHSFISAAGIAVTIALFCLALGTGVGRGTLRGPEYIRDSRYYSAMAVYVTLLILAIFSRQQLLMKKRFARVSRLALAFIVGALAVSNAVQLRKTVPILYAGSSSAANRFALALDRIKSDGLCVGGYDPLVFHSMSPEYLLLRNYRCDLRAGIPVYLANSDKGLILTQLTSARSDPLPVTAFSTPDGWTVSGPAAAPRWSFHGSTAMVMTTGALGDAGVAILTQPKPGEAFNGGLVFGLQDQANYYQFVVESGKVYEQQVVNGAPNVRREERLPVGMAVKKLESRCASGNLYLLVNDLLLMAEPNLCPAGKVGFFVSPQAKQVEIFDIRRPLFEAPSAALLTPLDP